VPAKNLAPANGTLPRYRLQEWLTFIGMEIHRSFTPLFNAAINEDAKQVFRDRVAQRLKYVDGQLDGKQYLMGDTFSVADAYLFAVSNWSTPTKVDVAGLKNLEAFRARMQARPAVQEAMKAEGLIK
jgi:glutathione S-transferase